MRRIVIGLFCVVGCANEIAVEDWGKEAVAASCKKQFECCTAEEITAQGMGLATYASEEACNAALGGLVALLTTPVNSAVAAGTIVYDGEKMAECLDEVLALSCGDYSASQEETISSCDKEVFAGQVAKDGVCSVSQECAAGSCVGASFLTGAKGKCGDLPGDGAACAEHECAEGFYCNNDTCAAAQAEGADCFFSSECASGICTEDKCAAKPVTCDGK